MSAPGPESLEAYQNRPTDAPQYLVPTNDFMRIIQDTLGFTNSQVFILAEVRYEPQDIVLYKKFIEIIY